MQSVGQVAEGKEETSFDMEVVAPSALVSMEVAQIDIQIATAKKYPRDLARVKRELMSLATLDDETAAACFYSLPRGGKSILGPSVRLAEMAVYCYQNLRVASRVIENDGKSITAQGVCYDLERNNCISSTSSRRILDKNGKTYNDDMQLMTGNAACSIAFRNAVFDVIPMALVKPAYEAARAVAVGNASTLVEKRTKMFGRLAQMQVTPDRILAKLNKSSIENVDLSDLEILIGLGTAIKDGATTVDEAFPPVEGTKVDQKAAAAEKLADLNKRRGQKPIEPDVEKRLDEVNKNKAAKPKDTPAATSAPATAGAAGDAGLPQQKGQGTDAPPAQSGKLPYQIVDLIAMRDKVGQETWSDIILKNGFAVPTTDEALLAFTPEQVLLLTPDFELAYRARQASAEQKPAAASRLKFGTKGQS